VAGEERGEKNREWKEKRGKNMQKGKGGGHE